MDHWSLVFSHKWGFGNLELKNCCLFYSWVTFLGGYIHIGIGKLQKGWVRQLWRSALSNRLAQRTSRLLAILGVVRLKNRYTKLELDTPLADYSKNASATGDTFPYLYFRLWAK